jgi:hypothetical protein
MIKAIRKKICEKLNISKKTYNSVKKEHWGVYHLNKYNRVWLREKFIYLNDITINRATE